MNFTLTDIIVIGVAVLIIASISLFFGTLWINLVDFFIGLYKKAFNKNGVEVDPTWHSLEEIRSKRQG